MQWQKVSDNPPQFGSYTRLKRVLFASKTSVWFGQVDNLGVNNSLRWMIVNGNEVIDIPRSMNDRIIWWFEIDRLPQV